MKRLTLTAIGLVGLALFAMANSDHKDQHANHSHAEGEVCTDACAVPSEAKTSADDDFKKSESEWKKILDDNQFHVLRKQGTEPPFRNAYWDNKEKGIYVCAGCQAPLFASKQKYKSGTGWPSFYDAVEPKYVGETVDRSHGMVRTEVHCNRCGGHLGHVFPDGPRPTNLRYCINSASLDFVKADQLEENNLADYATDAK